MTICRCGGCCTTLRGEVICGPMFDLVVVDRRKQQQSASLEEGGAEEEGATLNGEAAPVHRHLGVIRTFSPRPRPVYITIKLFLAAWILAILTMSIDRVTYPNFWLAYLTHWGYVITAMYGVMSPICAMYLALRPPPPESVNTLTCCGTGGGGVAGFLVKTTWALLAIVVPAEVIITILFWALEYEAGESISYVTVMVHGGTMILLFIDGFVLSRIPLRLKQFVFFETFSSLYLLWNIIHAYSGIGNPYDGVSQDDDAIYSSLDWNTTPTKAIIMSVLVLLVANPIMYGICWLVSRMLPLRLVEDDGQPKGGRRTLGSMADEEHEQVPVVIH
ncbi:hypothetical protein ACHAXH_002488 [Discostella pseudostelligera]